MLPIALIGVAASLIADQAKKKRARELAGEDRDWEKGDVLQNAFNHRASAMGGDPFQAAQTRQLAGIDRGYRKQMEALEDQPAQYAGSVLGLVSGGSSLLDGVGGAASAASQFGGPGSGDAPTSPYDFEGADDVAAASPYAGIAAGGAVSPLQAGPAAAGAGGVQAAFDELNRKYRRRW